MSQILNDVVLFRGDRLFNGAVSIDWFGKDDAKARVASEAFAFHGPEYHGVTQADVGSSHGHTLLDTASFARGVVRRCYGFEDKPFTLAIAGYGTGKSHLGLTLATLLSNPKSKTAQAVLTAIDSADETVGSEIRAILKEDPRPCLTITLNGMQNFDLAAEMTQQVIREIRASGLETKPIDQLRPRFTQAASLIRMSNSTVIEALLAACGSDTRDAILAGLEEQNEQMYKQVHAFFAAQGMPIRALGGESVKDMIEVASREYCGIDKHYRSLLVLFDEFGRYTEFATTRSQIAGSGVLQDLFEGIQAYSSTACFVGFIQFDMNAYVQRVGSEYRNEILRYVTRYQSADRAYLSTNLETLIANLLEKRNPSLLDSWFENGAAKAVSKEILGNLGRWFPQTGNYRLWHDRDQFHTVIRKGCWPLSPYSTWFLFYLAAAGKHLQERSALALLKDAIDRFKDWPLPVADAWTMAPADLWSEALQQELISSEETGTQGSITHSYASVEARHGARFQDDLRRILRAVVLASKMGLQAKDRGDALHALSQLAGLHFDEVEKGVRLLQDEYNVLEWDEAFKEFDILGDAVPRTQFLAFIRQRVASSFDEAGKARLFAGKAFEWCDRLGDLECDFAEENRISTQEWRFQGEAAHLDLDCLPMQIKSASARWSSAVGVDTSRGTILYCYVEPSRDSEAVNRDTNKILRSAAREAGVPALPILVVFLYDANGELGQALAELAVLEESLSEEDRVKFGNLIGAHKEKMRQMISSIVESMIKERRYATGLSEELEANRLSRVGTELFARVYRSPLPFPFDGFSTARGNAADSCQELTADLFLSKLDYDAVMAKPMKVKNRALTVLRETWGVFTKTGGISRRPSYPAIKAITEKWDSALSTDGRLPIAETLRDLCRPPYGANIASAGLLLAVFVASRADKMAVFRNGQQYAVSQLMQDGLFRGKYIDIDALQGVDLVLLGEESSEWEVLLDEWDQAESYLDRRMGLERANDLKGRVPVPPSLVYKFEHHHENATVAIEKLGEMKKKQDDAFHKLESGTKQGNVGVVLWAAATLKGLIDQMVSEKVLWTDHQIQELKPSVENARQWIIQKFRDWLSRETPTSDSPDAVSTFKHQMIHQVGGNLKKLELSDLYQALEARTQELIRNVETASEARGMIQNVRSWLTSHGDASRFIRIAEIRSLKAVARDHATKLQGMASRIEMASISEVRSELSQFAKALTDAETVTKRRASPLGKASLDSEEQIGRVLDEVESLLSVYENCPGDLEDFQGMRNALRIYQRAYQQLGDDRLTWTEFENAKATIAQDAESALGEAEPPWPPKETVESISDIVSKRRKEASAVWIQNIESAAENVTSMSAPEANRLHERVTNPPAVLTDPHANRLKKARKTIESRLEALDIEWLVEKFRNLSDTSKKKFIRIINEMKEKG